MSNGSSVNFLKVVASPTGLSTQLAVDTTSSDANVNIQLSPKGSGTIVFPIANIQNFANDAAAASGGIPIGGIYRNGSVVQIRVS
jgi:hypothetical protein